MTIRATTNITEFVILEVPDNCAESAKVIYRDRYIVPRCYIAQILKEAADRACSIWLDQDCVFYKEIEHFKEHIEVRLREAIRNDGFSMKEEP
jgi:hypothetical protein